MESPARRHATRRSRWSPFYAGARISEIVALDIDDVARSARKGVLRILGKGDRVRQVRIHPQLHAALTGWLAERADWPGATDTPALFLNTADRALIRRASPPSCAIVARSPPCEDQPDMAKADFGNQLSKRKPPRRCWH